MFFFNSCRQAFWGVKRNVSNKYASVCSVLLISYIQVVFLNNDNLVHNKEINIKYNILIFPT